MKRNKDTQRDNSLRYKKKKFKLDKEAVKRIEAEFDDRDLTDFTNYKSYDEIEYPKTKRKFIRKIVIRLIILCLIVIFVNVIILLSTGQLWFNEPKKRDYPIRGPVVTENMGQINWNKFSQQNIQMAYIRATKSTAFQDKYFEYNWENSEDAEIPVGALHVFDFGIDGKTQAEHFCKTIGSNMKNRLVPAVQVKLYGFYTFFPPNYEDVVQRLEDFVYYVNEFYGVSPIIYCNSRTYKKYIKGNLDGCPIWFESLFSKIDDKIDWDFWGYTNKVRFSFYENNKEYLYMTVFKEDEKSFQKFIMQ